jgi:hypothetical protein
MRLVAELGDPVAALALYEHSVACGHGRIALLRYLDARRLNAPFDAAHHAYVQRIAARLSAEQLRRIAQQAQGRHARLRRGT